MKNILGWFGVFVLSLFMTWAITSQYSLANPIIVEKTIERIVEVPIRAPILERTIYKPAKYTDLIMLNIKSPKAKCSTGHGQLWDLKWAAESSCGKKLWQRAHRSHRAKNKLTKKGYPGHFAMGWPALKDIKCESNKCLKDRFKFEAAIKQAKDYHKVGLRTMSKSGCSADYEVYIQYLMHQQGAGGMCRILKSASGKDTKLIYKVKTHNAVYDKNKKLLKKAKYKTVNVRRHMTDNSTITRKSAKKMSNTTLSKLFLLEWKIKISKGGIKL